MGKNRVLYRGRAFAQDAHNAMKGDIVRGLIELITNCDDAYGEDSGRIRVEVEHRRKKPWKIVVRDRACGMSADRMIKAIGGLGGRTSGFEEGREVRGNLGRGAKDLAAFGPASFESIHSGGYAALTLEEDGTFDDPVRRKAGPEDRERLGIPRGSGTVVTVLVREQIRCPQHQKLLEKLSTHCQLRDINSDPRRDLTLIDLNHTRTDAIRYSRPSLEEVRSVDLVLPQYPEAAPRLTIWRNAERYDNPPSETGRPEGILVTGARAVYENTLFSFESNVYSGWFSGRVECQYIDRLAREYDERRQNDLSADESNPIPIIVRDRSGLQHDHPFYKTLAEAVEVELEPLVRQEEEAARSGAARESAHMRKALDALGRDLGKLIDNDLRELDEDGLAGRGTDEGDVPLRIIPDGVVMYLGEDKTLSVVALKSLMETELHAAVDPEGVVELVDGPSIPLEDHPRRDDYVIARVRLRPLIEDEDTYLYVRVGDLEATALIEVRPERLEPDPQPPEEFRFERDRYRLTHAKPRKLLLQAPASVVEETGATAHVTSDSNGIVVRNGGVVELEFDERDLYFIGHAAVDPRELGAGGKLRARLGGGDVTATCDVQVGAVESGPSLNIRIVDQTAGKYRAIVKRSEAETTIEIQGGHMAIRRYLGPGPEFPHQDTPVAKIVLAEIIAGEAARMVLEAKYQAVGELDGPGFYSEHLRYMEKYLARCHKQMLPELEL